MAIKLIKTFGLIILSSLFTISCTPHSKDAYTDKTAAEIYELAQKHESKNNYHLAVKDYEAIEARFPYGEYADKAQIGLAKAYYKKGEAVQSLAEIERFINMYPRHANIDYIYYLKGLVYYDQYISFLYRHLPLDRSLRDPTDAIAGFESFSQFIERFPTSEYVKDAETKKVFLKNQLANHQLHIAHYYMKKSAYVAAANRANTIITEYKNTLAVPEALLILTKAYNLMGAKTLAIKALDLLKKDYVNSKEYAQALNN